MHSHNHSRDLLLVNVLDYSGVITLSRLDWGIFLATIGLTLLVGWYAMKRKPHHEGEKPSKQPTDWTDYLLMGRKLTLPLFVATLVATWYGDILGVTQIAFQYGVYNFVTQGFFWYISYIAFALLMVKYIRKQRVKSFPELFGQLVGEGGGKATAVMVFLKTLPVTYAVGMGIFLSTVLPISFSLAMGLGLACIFSYSLLGGFRAIVFSDFLQVICMYAGVIAVVVASFSTFGGLGYLIAHCPPTHFAIRSTFSILDTLVWFFIACATTFLNPTFYQRSLAATTDRVAIRGIFIATGCWFVFDSCTTLIGLYARAAMPDASPIHAALAYSLAVLPTGWKGLFLGAVLATLLSTLDSFLFIASTTLTYDLRLIRGTNTNRTHILSSLVTILLTFCIALCFQGNFESTWRMIKSIFTSCTFPILVIGYWKPRVITQPIFIGVFMSVLLAVPLWTLYKPWPLDAFYVGQIVGWVAAGIGLSLREK